MTITELKYSNTNTYLINTEKCKILFDTGWAGTFQAFCKAMGEIKEEVQSIDCLFISHFHPDHMGIAQDIAELGATIVVADVQAEHIHDSDKVFEKEKRTDFNPIKDDQIKIISIEESREFLKKYGVNGQVLYTPGHSDDSISLWLDDGELFVGDLNPLYELELHRGTLIEESWNSLLKMQPKKIYYGHAKATVTGEDHSEDVCPVQNTEDENLYHLVKQIMKYTDKEMPIEKIIKKTGAEEQFITKVIRMYLTHQNIGVQGILDRIM